MTFTPGLQLSERFYRDAVRPILDDAFPGLAHAAALIGSGSEVLGFDDAMSTDHHWGPRVLLFVGEADHARHAEAIRAALARRLPVAFGGYPTNFGEPDPEDSGTQLLRAIEAGPVNHRVEVHTLQRFFEGYVGMNITRPLEPADWLLCAEQRLRAVTAGAVYHDEVGLEGVRARLAYYPRDVWLYRLAAGWARIGQEEHLMGRAGLAGDELGSALIGGRLVRDIMRLAFLMERVYAPYAKWFGSAFRRLACGPALEPALRAALQAPTWPEREAPLVTVYERLAAQHNALGLTRPQPEQTKRFFGRPFRVIALHGFADALLALITDPAVRRIADRPPIGGIDQFSDSTDLVDNMFSAPALRGLYK
jgi:hypothetical protein